MHVLTLVADRAGAPLSDALVGRVRDALGGGAVSVLSPAEAVELALDAAPDLATVRAALDGAPVDAIAQPGPDRTWKPESGCWGTGCRSDPLSCLAVLRQPPVDLAASTTLKSPFSVAAVGV